MKINLMKNITTLIFLFLTCIIFQTRLFAQDSTLRQKFIKDSIEKEMDSVFADAPTYKVKSFWLADINYLNNNVYLGRKDSVPSPYLTASLGYFHKSGLFINASASYLTEPGQGRIDLAEIDGGYSLITKKFEGIVTLAKYFFSSESYNVRSEIEGSADIFSAYDLGFIKPTLQVTLNFGDNTDYAATIGLEHSFFALKKGLSITPTIVMNASTQNYYNNYYKLRRYAIKRLIKKFPNLSSISAFIENPSQFKVLDYEGSIPINYSIKQFTFSFTPSFAIPVNPAIVDATVTTRFGSVTKKIKKEKLKDSLFFTVGVSYSF
jgi:hypothetical protein